MQHPENTLTYRIESIEREVTGLKQQLERYVPARENDLQLQSIRSTVERIERDVQDARKQVTDLGTKLVTQQTESERRDTAQRESQASLQIKVLIWFVSIVVTVLLSVLIAFLTGLF